MKTLEEQASKLIALSVAPSTRKKYAAHIKSYKQFCESALLPPFPVTEQSLIFFATHLSSHLSHSNISAHIAAIKYMSQVHGFDLDLTPFSRLYRLLRGIKRSQGAKFKKPPRIPITPPFLFTLGRNLWNSSYPFGDKLMLWAAMLTAFYGFLRVSEYTSTHVKTYDPAFTLCFSDLSWLSPSSIQLHIKASKTDPFRAGVHISLHANNSPLCPIKALRPFLNHHPFKAGPLFVWQDGRHLTRAGFSSVLKRIGPQGMRNVSSHSFRIGAASTAAAAGHPRWLIQAMGRWTSNCFRDYIRIPKSTLLAVSKSLATQTSLAVTPFDPDNIQPES